MSVQVHRDGSRVQIVMDGRHIGLSRGHAQLLAGRIDSGHDITITETGGSLIYRAPRFGSHTLAIIQQFLKRPAVRVDLSKSDRQRLIKMLSLF